MDRRQIKTRSAIISAFVKLLSHKRYEHITVGEIIDEANVGRATFYSHFETKQYLLKSLCDELFCHLFDCKDLTPYKHAHIFTCEATDSAFIHLFYHIQKNDNHLLDLLSSTNNELFLDYFQDGLKKLVEAHLPYFQHRKNSVLPDEFWSEHICVTYIHTIKWWISNGLKQPPEQIAEYFYLAV